MEVVEVVEEEEEERLTSPPPAAEVWTIRLRGNLGGMKEVSVPVKTTDEVGTIVDFVNNVIDPSAEREYARIIHKGKTLALTGTVEGSGMKNGDQVGVMFSKRHEIEAMNKTDSMKPSRLMRSFEEEEEINRRRIEGQNSAEAASYWGEVQDERHKFFKFETVPRFVEPHPYEADRLLLKLATDPGIKFVMKKYQFSVFKLCEMDPLADGIAQKKEQEGAYLLGYNENAGAAIYLRLRTDDEREFRDYDQLVNTLLHELTHNVHGPHDENFWKLFAELKKEYLQVHANAASSGRARKVRSVSTKVTTTQVRRNLGSKPVVGPQRNEGSTGSMLNDGVRRGGSVPSASLGATHSRARMEAREKFAAAAERRFQQKSNSDHDDDNNKEGKR